MSKQLPSPYPAVAPGPLGTCPDRSVGQPATEQTLKLGHGLLHGHVVHTDHVGGGGAPNVGRQVVDHHAAGRCNPELRGRIVVDAVSYTHLTLPTKRIV